jgi:hypothetical protein
MASHTCSRKLIGQAVECEGRHKAYDALGYTLGGLSQTVISVERRIGELIKAPRKPKHLSVPLHAAHRGGRYASVAQLYKARNSTRRQEGLGDVALGDRCGH